MYSRLLRKQSTGPDPEKVIGLLQTKYSKACNEISNLESQLNDVADKYKKICRKEHDEAMEIKRLTAENKRLTAEAKNTTDLQNQIHTLQHQNSSLNRVLQTQMQQQKDIQQQHDNLQQQLLDVQRQYETLDQTARTDQAEHIKIESHLQHNIAELEQQKQQFQQQVNRLQHDLHTKTTDLQTLTELTQKSDEEHKKEKDRLTELQNENTALKQTQTNAISEYRSSPELIEEIVAEFGKGFRAALLKVQTAGIDPKSLGFSEDDMLWLEEDPTDGTPNE